MILIADSGSTKCDWRLINQEGVLASVSTMGLNPFFHDADTVQKVLSGSRELFEVKEQVCSVYFYGAGCSSEVLNQIMKRGLRQVFQMAEIHVDHDIKGAARAANQGQPGIACILGTGSNACYFDETEIRYGNPSLGYILGDEGSGSWFGKHLLRDYLYQEEIPEKLRQELDEVGKEVMLNRIYREPNANVYLASFSKILSKHLKTDYVDRLIRSGLRTFLLRHVCCFENHLKVHVNFVGSIAFHFQDFLKQEAEKLGVETGNIIQKPIEGLVQYHSMKE